MLPYSYLVLGVNPTSNESDVKTNSNITITFAKHINVDTLNANTIRLKKVNGGFVEYTGKYFADTKTFVLHPSNLLEPGVQYQTVVIGGVDGVRAVDGAYLPSTKTYEFTTAVMQRELPTVKGLSLSQFHMFIKAKWDLPVELLEGETALFIVKVSEFADPSSPSIWPEGTTEWRTSSTEITIPYEFKAEKNYYIHVKAVVESVKEETAWSTSQIYIEPAQTIPTPPVSTPPVTSNQLAIEEHFPAKGSYEMPSEIIIVFNDELQLGQESLVYVVEAAPKEPLTFIDMRGAYSPTKAIPGIVTIDTDSPNVLIWTPDQYQFTPGKEYTVITSKQLQGVNYGPIGYTYVFGFTATPLHMYGNISVIREMLGEPGSILSNNFLMALNRKYSQFAYEIWSETDTFDESLISDGGAPYFLEQYVNTQVAIDCLLHVSIQGAHIGNENIRLGELNIVKGSSSASSVAPLIGELKKQLKKWEDAIHGYSNRGYAKPGSVVKGESASPYPEPLTRTTEVNFDK